MDTVNKITPLFILYYRMRGQDAREDSASDATIGCQVLLNSTLYQKKNTVKSRQILHS